MVLKTGYRAWPMRHRIIAWPNLARYGLVACLFTLFLSSLLILRSSSDPTSYFRPRPRPVALSDAYLLALNRSTEARHAIDDLIADAKRTQETILAERSTDLKTAARRYRARRHRHPPPGFDKWFEYAKKHDAIVVEKFFDRIYHDLLPFWALDPKQTATRAASWSHVVRVRNGVAEGVGDTQGRVPWLKHWTDLVTEAAEWLPDVDMPINYMDESRIITPWEEINGYVEKALMWRKVTPLDQTVRKYTGLAKIDAIEGKEPYEPEWIKHDSPRFWNLARTGCAPDSPAHDVPALADYSLPPAFPDDWAPSYSEKGYVKNFTAATDPCIQPHLRALHGSFVEPITMSTTKELIPLFGGCKLPVNNEILIPGAMYLTKDPFYSGGETHGPPWLEKQNGIVWRGVASGGRNKAENWPHFQRHRLVEMLNGTTVGNMERNGARAMTFELPPKAVYDFPRRQKGEMGQWLTNMSDVGFNNLLCFPKESNCTYVAPYFHEKPSMPMVDQYKNKYMPDVDGNSFSARFRGLLLSTSLPLKSTIYAEWHDDRLLPWLHFAPFDNTFQDLYGVLDYFTRDLKGDLAAWMVAETGKIWGEQVLRREDMLLYVWRLLLEFARVCDENRDRLGFIDDLAQPQDQ